MWTFPFHLLSFSPSRPDPLSILPRYWSKAQKLACGVALTFPHFLGSWAGHLPWAPGLLHLRRGLLYWLGSLCSTVGREPVM